MFQEVNIAPSVSMALTDMKSNNFIVNNGPNPEVVYEEEALPVAEQSSLKTLQCSSSNLSGELRKGRTNMDFCFFCETYVLNFARHIQRNHSIESEVAKIMVLPKRSVERHQSLQLLRKKGNFLVSNETPKAIKRSKLSTKMSVCDHCLGFFASKYLWRHRKVCVSATDKNAQIKAQNFLLRGTSVDPKLKDTVFNRMRADSISLVAKKDILICAFASRYLQKNREKHHELVASNKMREMARLLIELRRMDKSINTLFDALKPQFYDLFVEATKVVSRYNKAKEYYEAPTYARNIGTTIKQCCDIAIKFALKRKHIYGTVLSATAEADIRSFQQLISSEWRFDVASKADTDLCLQKWNKITIVPLASDLRTLRNYLSLKAVSAMEKLSIKNDDCEAYKTLQETIYCRVLLLNRRRPGELERLFLHSYQSIDNRRETYEEFSEIVTPSERVLLKKFKRLIIRGKRGRGVPVLFCPDVQHHIKVLLKYRHNFVTHENMYLFGNPNTLKPICGYKILKKHAIASGAKNPSAITATKLRKHLATLTQVISMSDNDIEQLASFMGHTVGVHKGSYRLPDDVFQTAKISKLLLLMESGEAAEYKGKALDEIDIDLDQNLLEITESDDEPNDPENYDLSVSDLNISNNSTVSNKKVRTKPRKLIPWTEQQKKLVNTFFADHILNCRPPKKHECVQLKDRNPIILSNKDWLKIKVYVQNQYVKKKVENRKN